MTTLAISGRSGRLVGLAAIGWAGLLIMASASGLLSDLSVAGLTAVVLTLGVIPTLLWLALPALRSWTNSLSLRAITALHVWRIGAAILFLQAGAEGRLPGTFVLLAGWGDMIAGILALIVTLFFARRIAAYWTMHVIGLDDFLVAVGTGITLTIVGDPLMGAVTTLPLALIPFLGVPLSFATHVIAFDRLRRGRL